jgi:hypothetical protein
MVVNPEFWKMMKWQISVLQYDQHVLTVREKAAGAGSLWMGNLIMN